MTTLSSFSLLSSLAAATLTLAVASSPAHAGGDNMVAFAGGALVGALVMPYLQSYQPNTMVNYGPVYSTVQMPPVVYNSPTPMMTAQPMMVSQPMVVNQQPAVVYSSAVPTSPPQVIYSGPSMMPYILVR